MPKTIGQIREAIRDDHEPHSIAHMAAEVAKFHAEPGTESHKQYTGKNTPHYHIKLSGGHGNMYKGKKENWTHTYSVHRVHPSGKGPLWGHRDEHGAVVSKFHQFDVKPNGEVRHMGGDLNMHEETIREDILGTTPQKTEGENAPKKDPLTRSKNIARSVQKASIKNKVAALAGKQYEPNRTKARHPATPHQRITGPNEISSVTGGMREGVNDSHYGIGQRVMVDPEANQLGPKDPHPRRGQEGHITKETSRVYRGITNKNIGTVHVKFDKGGEEEIDKRHIIHIREATSQEGEFDAKQSNKEFAEKLKQMTYKQAKTSPIKEETKKITHLLDKKHVERHKEWMNSEGFDDHIVPLPKSHPKHATHVGVAAGHDPVVHMYAGDNAEEIKEETKKPRKYSTWGRSQATNPNAPTLNPKKLTKKAVRNYWYPSRNDPRYESFIPEAFYTDLDSWREDMREHGATKFEETKTRIIAKKPDGDILGAWSVGDKHGITGLGTNVQAEQATPMKKSFKQLREGKKAPKLHNDYSKWIDAARAKGYDLMHSHLGSHAYGGKTRTKLTGFFSGKSGWLHESQDRNPDTVETHITGKGPVIVAHRGHSYAAVLHPHNVRAISAMPSGGSGFNHQFKDEQGHHWVAHKDATHVHLQGSDSSYRKYNEMKVSFPIHHLENAAKHLVKEGRESEYSANRHLSSTSSMRRKPGHYLMRHGTPIHNEPHATSQQALSAYHNLSDKSNVKIQHVKEDAIVEVSNKTLHSYIHAATKDMTRHQNASKMYKYPPFNTPSELSKSHDAQAAKRQKGLTAAGRTLARNQMKGVKEETTISKLFSVGDKVRINADQHPLHGHVGEIHHIGDYGDHHVRFKGQPSEPFQQGEIQKIARSASAQGAISAAGSGMAEETISELSKKTLGSYVKKAADDVSYNSFVAGSESPRPTAKKYDVKSFKRQSGIGKAVARLTKEDAVAMSAGAAGDPGHVQNATDNYASQLNQGKKRLASMLRRKKPVQAGTRAGLKP